MLSEKKRPRGFFFESEKEMKIDYFNNKEADMIRCLPVLVFILYFVPVSLCWSADSGIDPYHQKVTAPVRDAVKIMKATQEQEEKWREEKQKLAARYEQLSAEQGALEDRHNRLSEENRSAEKRIAEKEKQLSEIDRIRQQIEPFLYRQVGWLYQQMGDDLPFLSNERTQRFERLGEILEDPDVTVSGKYRKTMEALLVEAGYGNTIEAYRQTITVDNNEMLVNVFRLGRISLFYQSLDRSRCGFYNVADAQWQELPPGYNREIGAAVDMAAKRKPVELLILPLGRMSVK